MADRRRALPAAVGRHAGRAAARGGPPRHRVAPPPGMGARRRRAYAAGRPAGPRVPGVRGRRVARHGARRAGRGRVAGHRRRAARAPGDFPVHRAGRAGRRDGARPASRAPVFRAALDDVCGRFAGRPGWRSNRTCWATRAPPTRRWSSRCCSRTSTRCIRRGRRWGDAGLPDRPQPRRTGRRVLRGRVLARRRGRPRGGARGGDAGAAGRRDAVGIDRGGRTGRAAAADARRRGGQRPLQCVVSGPVDAVDAFAAHLRNAGSRMRRSRRRTRSIRRRWPTRRARAGACRDDDAARARIPMISNLDGTLLDAQRATDPAYWAAHVLGTVRFGGRADAGGAGRRAGSRSARATCWRRWYARIAARRRGAGKLHGARARTMATLLASYGRLGEGRATDAPRRVRGRAPQAAAVAGLSVRAHAPLAAGPAGRPHRARAAAGTGRCAGCCTGCGRHPRAAAVETDDVRHALTRIWTECLGHERITPTDDFFALGGDSLLAGRVLARIHERLNAELTLEAFFSAPTIDGWPARFTCRPNPRNPPSGRP